MNTEKYNMELGIEYLEGIQIASKYFQTWISITNSFTNKLHKMIKIVPQGSTIPL